MPENKHYQIGPWHYDHNTGRLQSDSQLHTLRAKSNDVLWLLLRHPNQLLSKQAILTQVWDDVSAQEHVLFQSIREIRQCFGELDVIKTHPRKGYEWIAQISVNTPPASTSSPSKLATQIQPNESPAFSVSPDRARRLTQPAVLAAFVLFIAALLSLLWDSWPKAATTPQPPPPPFAELVIMPVTLYQSDSLTQWVPIGAMDMLIKKLQQTHIDKASGHIFVVDTDDVLEAWQRADVAGSADPEQQARKMRHAMGEITSVHTELYGAPMEYSLKYNIISRKATHQGLLTGESVVQLINQLAKQIPQHLNMIPASPIEPYKQRFANDAFVFGLSHFYQGEFDSASHYFQTAIQSGTATPQAHRYLAKTRLALGDYAGASRAAEEAMAFAQQHDNAREALRSQFELGVAHWHMNNFDSASRHIQATQERAKDAEDLLYLAFAIEMLGHLALREQHFSQAKHYYQQSLQYHQGFGCPYGQSGNYINLARLSEVQGQSQQSQIQLSKALHIAQESELGHFETRLHLLMAKNAWQANTPQVAESHLLAVRKLLQSYPNQAARQVLNDWPESAEKIN